MDISSLIKQKGKLQNGCYKKTKHTKFSEKLNFTCMSVSGSKKCSFFRKFRVLYFLVIPVLRFALLPYYRRYKVALANILLTSNTVTHATYMSLISFYNSRKHQTLVKVSFSILIFEFKNEFVSRKPTTEKKKNCLKSRKKKLE